MAVVASCAIEPKELEYGKDMCAYCKMTIVDPRHAAEFVTSKGKAYTFDAIECMINMQKDFPADKLALELVCDYSNPGTLISVDSAFFFISEEIPSPMGANLSAVSNPDLMAELLEGERPELKSWEEIKSELLD